MAKLQKTVTVTVDRAKDASGVIFTGLEGGYRISVHPWVVKPPPPPNPNASKDRVDKITWEFKALHNLQFDEITVNFKTKKHFNPIQQDGNDWVLKDTSAAATNKQIVGNFDGTFPFKSQNYNYILEFTLLYEVMENGVAVQKEDKIELDPGYRVYP